MGFLKLILAKNLENWEKFLRGGFSSDSINFFGVSNVGKHCASITYINGCRG